MDASTPWPDGLEPSHCGTLLGHGRTELAFCRWEQPAPKGRVVILHGYGEHGGRYRHTAKWLHGLGWSVSALDQKGFGRSGGKRGDARGIRPFVEDFALFLRQERLRDARGGESAPRWEGGCSAAVTPAWPQIVLGHSFGGLVAVLGLLWHPDALDGLILSSPVITMRPLRPKLRVLQAILATLAPHWVLDLPNDKSQVCSDPLFIQRYWEDPLCHRCATAAFARAMAQGRREILPFGSELDRPILLLESLDDSVVDPEGSEALWSSIRSECLERHRLTGLKHELLHDLRRQEVQTLVEPWLERFVMDPARNSPGNSAMIDKAIKG